jgi:diguanylate cyclase (GGDEF)-like protein/PAS domain S-box-containing protein
MDAKQKQHLTLIALAGVVAVFAIGNYGLGFQQWTVHWWADTAWTIASLLTGVKCLQTAKHLHGQHRRAWILFGAACFAWFLGMLYWDFQELIRHQITPFPAYSDLGFLLFAPLVMAGMLWYRADAPTAPITLKQICNLGIIISAISMAVPVILIGSLQASTESRLYLAGAVAYPVLYLAAFLFGLTCLWLYVWGPNRRVFAFLLAGFATHALTDTLYASSLLGKTYEAGNYLDVCWIIGFALIYAAAVKQEGLSTNQSQRLIPAKEPSRARELENFVSVTALVVVATVLYVYRQDLRGDMVTYVYALGVVGVALVGTKEWWGYRVEQRLHDELRSSLDALKANETRLAGILEIAPEGIISVDARQRITLFNKGAQSIFGYAESEALGQPLDLLIPERFQAAHHGHVEGFAASPTRSRRMNERQEIYGRRRDGTEFPAEASLSKLDAGNERVLTVVLRDITERKQVEERLHVKTDQLEAVTGAMTAYLETGNWSEAGSRILRCALAQTTSEYGFVGVVVEGPALRIFAHEGITWDSAINRALYEDALRTYRDVGYLEFTNFQNLFGRVITSGQAVISNDPGVDPRAGGCPHGHPPLRAFMGVPILRGTEVVGMIGVANRPGGYGGTEQSHIEILCQAAGVLFDNYRQQQREIGLEAERKQAQERLDFLAHYDPLTGLPNRVLFNDRLKQTAAQAVRHQRVVAVLFLDLDRFKTINDTLGHDVGDLVLKAVAERLCGCVRSDDTVAHLGGNGYAVILADMAQTDDVAKVAQKILDTVSQPIQLADRELFVTASIGITVCPTDDQIVDNLLKNADTAMYRAKDRGCNTYQVYTPDMNARAVERLAIETQLRRALERQEFLLHYQPQVDLGTGRIVGVEALVRWQRPESGLVSPAEFIPLAEETGLIGEIGEWVLRTACAHNRAWQDAGLPEIRVAVNVSACQFAHKDFVDTVARILRETGLPPSSLELEVTESLVMEHAEATVAKLAQFHAMGIALAIDDFGTGYSSLSYLQRFPIDSVKIDQSFVRDVPTNADHSAITAAMIGLAHNLRLTVVAEGVETEDQVAFLRAHHCEVGQGYLFSRPVPYEAFSSLLKSRWCWQPTPGAKAA